MTKLPAILLVVTSMMSLQACVAEPAPRRHAVVEINVRPPEPRVIVVPASRRGYVWTPGYWRWNGRSHLWVDGRWVREKHGEHWVPAHWEEGRSGYYHFEKGHWER